MPGLQRIGKLALAPRVRMGAAFERAHGP